MMAVSERQSAFDAGLARMAVLQRLSAPTARDLAPRKRGADPWARCGRGDDPLVCDFRQPDDSERPALGTKRRISTPGAALKLVERASAAYLTARAEERDSIAAFAPRYVDYSAKTARFVPCLF